MNRAILNERLGQLISRYGATAIETRQIAKRLHALLASRFSDLKREHAARLRGTQTGRTGGKAERLALADERMQSYVDEYVEIFGDALKARIQYETHAMLYRARQSLRTVKR